MRTGALILFIVLFAAVAQVSDRRAVAGPNSGKLWTGTDTDSGASSSGKLWTGTEDDASEIGRSDGKEAGRHRGSRSDGQSTGEADDRRPRRSWQRKSRRYAPVWVRERDKTSDLPVDPDPIATPIDPETKEPASTPADPSGGMVRHPARGLPAPRTWTLGEPLPRSTPHVTLAPSVYGLPRPPAGQTYARVGADVLLIEATTRRVMSVVTD